MFWKDEPKNPPRDVRESYDPSHYDGGKLFTDKRWSVEDALWNIQIQNEVIRRNTNERLDRIAAGIEQLVEVQKALLDELRKR
uniref:hypothetical protein n=1 Tax=Brucella pseudintermedia TaxID=370111 RepID=UPI00158ED13B|nr:hypothetical protein [Brucella pseudintermedia]